MMSMTPYYTVSRSMKPRLTRNERSMTPFGEEFFRTFFGENTVQSMKVDVQDKGDSYLLEADLPGVKKDCISLSVENSILTISVEQKKEQEDEDSARSYVYRERRVMSMSRSFSLEGVQEEGITAEYADGVLRLTLPKVVEQTPAARRIEING